MKKDIKQQLFSLCLNLIEQRISNAQLAISTAKESANDDRKSSAGDKHETGRAMAQLEQEKSGQQLKDVFDLKKSIEKLNLDIQSASAQVGSIVITDKGNFFILAPLGKLIVDENIYYAISISSPIGDKLKGRIKNESFEVKGIVYKILEVF